MKDEDSGLNPLSSLYFLGLRMDRYFTDTQSLPAPVLSVGNISVGGRGKTPFVIEICKHLKSEGYSPVVLTRGYGRSSKTPCFIDLNRNVRNWDVVSGGDEALEIAYFARVPVLVGPRRLDNAQRFIVENPNVRGLVFILDDGFQHWKIKRDFDLVLVNDEDYSDGMLPLGRLREPLSALARATLVLKEGQGFEKKTRIITKKNPSGQIYYLSTRVPSKRYAEDILARFPKALGLLLPDHAREGKISNAVLGSNADVLVLGAKEAVKVFSYDMFHNLVTHGSCEMRYAGKNRLFVYAHCDLVIADRAGFYAQLLPKLKQRSAQRDY